ncbi:hypothetical protein [Streptococcus uberis]|uniref:hypothetical protein n=1 Tax=Streptococcus uberis TaxID=1349 RepID=UPI0018E16093|nr:hypothetical protein [Streptococcus uberis]MBI0907780.1 hypothetical protein [Streptococcus uberis]MCK1167941.1 hypothetical protein [Streptococcus uberis]MCK1195422.1 hypothetical protein [Streptococcus uberis]MCK1199083.1 hypothetical protein [Streptococcus uberis]MCK1219403.1 hypothetical protein [Streptococcus uberis]
MNQYKTLEGQTVNTITDITGVVLVAEVINENDGTIVTTASDSNSVYIEETNQFGQVSLSTYEKELIRVRRAIRGQWQYTGIAVPTKTLTRIANMGVGAGTAALASIFGISIASVNAILSDVGGWSFGELLGQALDRNGNGWVGLYKRTVQQYPNGPIGYEHKTE